MHIVKWLRSWDGCVIQGRWLNYVRKISKLKEILQVQYQTLLKKMCGIEVNNFKSMILSPIQWSCEK